ncbi:MAG: fumarylacetoacetate hydrolase family protein [Bdellovibrionaceae bacterium]|nr:fumarylacetoacetate hydrolase family protein [Pseudobdellovibrionaceae bacterium]
MHKNIWAVGRNYADHAKEMNAVPTKEPMIFLKAGSSLNHDQVITLPDWSEDIHHELELAFLIDKNLNLSHMTLALDLTARDKQAEAKRTGAPWTLAKSFTGACPVGKWVPIQNIETLNLYLLKNEQIVQTTPANDMIFKPEFLLDYIKKHFPVMENDILLTGTPAGVGPCKKGDLLIAKLTKDNNPILTCHWNVK